MEIFSGNSLICLVFTSSINKIKECAYPEPATSFSGPSSK